MNSLSGRRRLLPSDDGADRPPEPPRRGGGGGGPPRRGSRRWLPWLLLGVVVIAVERVSMLVFTVPDLPRAAYGAAATVLGGVWVVAVLIGGVAFGRALRADRGR